MCSAQVSEEEDSGKRYQEHLGDKHKQNFPLAKLTREVYFYFQIKIKKIRKTTPERHSG